jgi:hypothetical protein
MKKTLLLLLCMAPMAFAADVTGRFTAGTKHEEPPMHAPANVSRMFAKTVARGVDASSIELPATGDSGMIIWTIPARPSLKVSANVSTRLRTPDGVVLERNDRGSTARGLRRVVLDAAETAELGVGGGAQEVVHVNDTVAAPYQLDVDIPEGVDGVTIVAAEPDSRLTLSTWAAPLSRQPGQPVTLHADLRNRDAGVAGATVTARLASPNGRSFATVDLIDRGDGVYEATLDDLPANVTGAWQVRFEAAGATSEGVTFARTGSGELFAERGAATLSSLRTEVIGNVLRVSVDADMHDAGNYRLDVFIADKDRNAIAWGEGARQLTIGATTLTMDVPLDASRADLFVDVRLLGLDEPGVAGRIVQ